MVLLGGGMSSEDTLKRFASIRVRGAVEFVREYRLNLANRIVFSGGPVYSKEGQSEAQLMERDFLELLKSENVRVETFLEDKSLSTAENATMTKAFFRQKGWPPNIILLTGVLHLRRAKRDFEAEGFTVCPISIASKKEVMEFRFP